MTRRSPFSALPLLALVGACSGPSAVLHVTPASGLLPTVQVKVCPVGSAITDCSASAELFSGAESTTRTLAIDDTHGDGAIAVQLTVQSPGQPAYCQQLTMLSLAGAPDVVVTVDECAISVAGGFAVSPCAPQLPVCSDGASCGPSSTLSFCDGIGGTEKPACCPTGQSCVNFVCGG